MKPSQPWMTTATLLLLTIVMLGLSNASLPRGLEIAAVTLLMLAQVALIAGHSMRLRRAHPGILWTFIGGLLLTAVVLYVAIAPDAARIQDMLPHL
jgi:hypothetical protein